LLSLSILLNLATSKTCEDNRGFHYLDTHKLELKIGSCWFVAKTNGTTCETVCTDVDMPFHSELSSHNGSAVGVHYFPNADTANEKNPFECARSNSLGQWTVKQSANGDVADQLWRKEKCRIMCPCKENVGDLVLSHEERYLVFLYFDRNFFHGMGICVHVLPHEARETGCDTIRNARLS